MGDLFEIGQNYIFYSYYGNKMGFQQISGRVISFEHPIVKIETNGLIRIINCSSAYFIEAIARSQTEEPEPEGLVLERDSST